jgi:hypothetical protein
MANRWMCIDHPASHGSFPQAGLDYLAAMAPALQPKDRYACPKCIAIGNPGWMRPTEVARLATKRGV